MGKAKAPSPPDPQATAAAQTGTNVATATANSVLGNVNQVTPYGSLTYNQTGTYTMTDPTTGKSYQLPRTTATQTLSAAQQKILNQNNAADLNLATLAATQSGKLNDVLSTPFSLGGAPAAGNTSSLTAPNYQQFAGGPQLQTSIGNTGTIQNQIAGAGNVQMSLGGAGSITNSIANAGNIQTGVANSGNIQSSVGNGGDITRTYGTDYGANVQQVQDALMSRMQPSLDQGRTALETKLANQGIQIGSAAYDSAMKSFGQQENDARYGAILNAGQEQTRLANLEAQKAGFENAAQAQAYGQGVTSGQFANSAQAQLYGQNANNMQLANAAQGQQYSQNANDAAFGNSAQAQRFGQNATAGQFANAAQGQQFGQNQAQAEFGNNAQAQGYTQAANNAQFGNSANQQMFANQNQATAGNNALADQTFNSQQAMINAQNTARANYLNEQYAARNQPINEITGLLSGAGVTSPNFVPAQGVSMPTVDYAGLVQQNYQNQMGAYNAQQAQSQSLMGGLFGLGSAFIMSDERTKEDIEKVGKVDGQNVYRFRYKAGGPMQLGVMAQEVEEDHPEAVREIGGIKHVNYGKLFRLGEAA